LLLDRHREVFGEEKASLKGKATEKDFTKKGDDHHHSM
jgi:hypothetical protein